MRRISVTDYLRPRINAQKGFALVDLMLGTAVSLVMMMGILRATAMVGEGRNAHREGDRLSQGAAALQYLFNNAGSSIITSGSAVGFANVYTPTVNELKAAGYLPQYWNPTLPFGGTAQFTVQRGVGNDLLGLVCDTSSMVRHGVVAPDLAAKVVKASQGTGVMTSQINPGKLNGPGMLNITSPINGPAVVCAWAYLPSPS